MFSDSTSDLKYLHEPFFPDDDDNTWDSTYQNEKFQCPTKVCDFTICKHAVAVGRFVVGTCHPNEGASFSSLNQDNSCWWTWQKCLGPCQVTSVTSNNDGSVIVAATDEGTVYLLRGSDGNILASRKISSSSGVSASLSWINGTNTGDKLLIEVPCEENDNEVRLPPNIILVSNIYGEMLNNKNSSIVADTARRMQIQKISMKSERDARAVVGCHIDENTIRLIGCDSEGQLITFDHDTNTKEILLVKSDIMIKQTNLEWAVDFDVGLRPQAVGKQTFFILSAHSSKDSTAIFWFNPISLESACMFEIPLTQARTNASKVVSISPVQPFSSRRNLAAAVAIKNHASDSPGTIYVVQILVDEIEGLSSLSKPHIIFTVPLSETFVSVSMTSIVDSIYSLRLKINKGTKETYLEFRPHETRSIVVGKIRSLLRRGDFDVADEILTSAGLDTLLQDSFAKFHPSEVALSRLYFYFSEGTKESFVLAQECLRRLSIGAITGKSDGIKYFLEAIDFVLQAPTVLSLNEYIFGLQDMVGSIESVLSTVKPEYSEMLTKKHKTISEKQVALQYLSSLKCSTIDKNKFEADFRSIESVGELFGFFIKNRRFIQAADLCKASVRTHLLNENLVMPLLDISIDVMPNEYLSLLRDIVIPRLSINHILLKRIRMWSCRLADMFDDNVESKDYTDEVIQLLEAVQNGTKELQVKMHSSFAIFSPFTDQINVSNKRRGSPRSTNSDFTSFSEANNSISTSFSMSTKKNVVRSTNRIGAELCVPTILELSALKAGASKANDTQLSAIYTEDDFLHDVTEDCVENKLKEATCLQFARSLGLRADSTNLKNFSGKGGTQFVAKELVRQYSSFETDNENRLRHVCEGLQRFCEHVELDKDQALLEYINEVCSGKDVSVKDIRETSSLIRLCSSTNVRCLGALSVFRAALLCGLADTELSNLSKEAIAWASCNSTLQSELEESSRLLQIDSIVLNYCGFGARELFRVDNPHHAVSLLHFITKQVRKDSVISDALSLCEAFHHLSPQDAVCNILQEAIMNDRHCTHLSLFEELLRRDVNLAEKSLISSIAFAAEILEECSSELKLTSNFERIQVCRKRARLIATRTGQLMVLALENALYLTSDGATYLSSIYCIDISLEKVKDIFLRIEQLQLHYDIFPSLSELKCTRKLLNHVTHFMEEVVDCYSSPKANSLNTKIALAKRACHLLTGGSAYSVSDFWCAASINVAKSMIDGHNNGKVVDFLYDIGILSAGKSEVAGRIVLSIALTLCTTEPSVSEEKEYFTAMQRVVISMSLLQDWSLFTANGKYLDTVVELARHVSVSYEVFTRSDEGLCESIDRLRKTLQKDAWARQLPFNTCISRKAVVVPLCRPALYPSWYIGDGLLLPPDISCSLGLSLCRRLVDWKAENCFMELYRLIEGQGAHSLSLRVICQSISSQSSSCRCENDDKMFSSLKTASEITVKVLAERSLGGTGSGITNAIVDSQLAISFLLHLPLKVAFADYRSCIPIAIKTQNFDRLLTLANVGAVASIRKERKLECSLFQVGWKNQQRFSEQCQALALKAKWWNLLQRHNVTFDSHLIDSDGKPSSDDGFFDPESRDKASLLPSIITTFSKTYRTNDVIRLCSMYAEAFSVSHDTVHDYYIQWLLSPQRSSNNGEHGNTRIENRMDLHKCYKLARNSLQQIEQSTKRSSVMRECLISMDNCFISATDYERYSIILSLYQESLLDVLNQDSDTQNLNPRSQELEAVNRRSDALTILLSVFTGHRKHQRPPFSKFFLPIQKSTKDPIKLCGILGPLVSIGDSFDPLQALDNIFIDNIDSSTISSLAPMCDALGLPSGYIHARSLISRYLKSKSNKDTLPSFEHDVVHVFHRIKSSSDKAILAEWCLMQYENNDEDKLLCLDLVLQAAIQASTEFEHRLVISPKDFFLHERIDQALETIKRLTAIKSTLSDKVHVKRCLRSSISQNNRSCLQVIESLIVELDELSRNSDGLAPEALIDFLYDRGSNLTANACLQYEETFSMNHFRLICKSIHNACNLVAEQYSHVDCGVQARRLSQRLLFYGDDKLSKNASLPKETMENTTFPAPENNFLFDDETIDFVMDLSSIETSEPWGNNVGSTKSKLRMEQKFTAVEESSALKEYSQREISEIAHQRVALQIAFVMAFASEIVSRDVVQEKDKENENFNANQKQIRGMKRTGLLTKLSTKPDSQMDNRIFGLCRELLQVVFAPNVLLSAVIGPNISFEDKEFPKTITFAMRHRALRAASVLCPEEALTKVVRDEGYLSVSGAGSECSLRKTTFGVFVAKEIEEMGLPLPHSDLLQLCTMNFPSYARTLWHHHRNDETISSKGRLLLLLVEMSLSGSSTDASFLHGLLENMVNIHLTRSLILALECCVVTKQAEESSDLVSQEIIDAVYATTRFSILDLVRSVNNGGCNIENINEPNTEKILTRIEHLISELCGEDENKQKYLSLVKEVKQLCLSDKISTLLFNLHKLVEKYQTIIEGKEV